MTLGEKIQELRRTSAMSQDTLAEKLDVSRQAVSKWERDEAVPETDKIVRIAQVFGVSTDYLLLDEAPRPQPQQPRQTEQPRQGKSPGDKLERFIRRHGYKVGYFCIVFGVLLCVISLLVMLIIPGIFSGVFDAAKGTGDAVEDFGSSWGSIQMEGDVPQGLLDQIYGQMGSDFSGIYGSDIFGQMGSIYDQQVEQMEQTATNTAFIISLLFSVPVLLVGIGLIVLGCVIIVKGKKIAAQVQ